MITFYVPEGESDYFEHEVDNSKKGERNSIIKYGPGWMHNGRLVVDLPRHFFSTILCTGPRGLKWQQENQEAMVYIASIKDSAYEVGDAFPGKDRPAPVTPAAKPKLMVKLQAPANVTHYSHAGHEHAIGKDRTVTVLDDVADVLRSHGFVDAA
jgi:hypothetical protein